MDVSSIRNAFKVSGETKDPIRDRTPIEPEIENESVRRHRLVTQARLATAIEPVGTRESGPDAEAIIRNMTSGKSSSKFEGNEKTISKDRDGEARN